MLKCKKIITDIPSARVLKDVLLLYDKDGS
jgi:hypothetical protein